MATHSVLHDEALRLADLGYPVFPVVANEKNPRTPHGFHDASCAHGQIEAWWSEWPDANIGLWCRDIIVIDVDGSNNPWLIGNPQRELDLAIGAVATTPRGGKHFYFRCPTGMSIKNSASELAANVDVRSAGGYVVVAPSQTANGIYQWLPDMSLHTSASGLPQPPNWLIRDLMNLQPARNRPVASLPNSIGSRIPEGRRNTALTSIAGGLRRNGANATKILEELRVENQTKCEPPLDDSELQVIARSVERYPPAIPPHDDATTLDVGNQDSTTGRYLLSTSHTDPSAMAFVREHYTRDGVTTLVSYAGALWRWNGRCYNIAPRSTISSEILEFLRHQDCVKRTKTGGYQPFPANPRTVAAVYDTLLMKRVIPDESQLPVLIGADGQFSQRTDLMVCANGVLNIRSRELSPHNPCLFITNAVDYDYDPDAARPSVFYGMLEAQFGEGSYQALQIEEFMGYALTRGLSIHKMLWLVGVPRSGKSTLANCICELVGVVNTSRIGLPTLAGEFGMAPLIGKQLAVIGEADFNFTNASIAKGRLLGISGGDSQTINRKGEPAITVPLQVKFILHSNQTPSIADPSGALASRVIPIYFSKSFATAPDPLLPEKLRVALPGILNVAIDGLNRLNRQGGFTPSPVDDPLTREIEEANSPMLAFVRARCELDASARVSSRDLIGQYLEWSGTADTPVERRKAGQLLRTCLPDIKKVESTHGDMYVGLRWKPS